MTYGRNSTPQVAAPNKSSQDGSGGRAQALVALGANIPSRVGPPMATLVAALRGMERWPLHVERVSAFYATPCFPKASGPDYVNAVAAVSGMADAHAVLKRLDAIEREFGRRRDTRWGRRTLDLDLIAMGDMVLPDVETYRAWRDLSPEIQRVRTPDGLILPHPRIQDRAFVLVPLLEIAPGWRNPVTGLTVARMHDSLPEDEIAAVRTLRADAGDPGLSRAGVRD